MAGIVTFSNLVLDTAGSYRLSFADGSLTGLETSSFTVVGGAAAKIAFGTAPATTPAGVSISPVTVNVEDKFGNTVTGDTSVVSLVIARRLNWRGASRNLAAFHASSGVATFSNLTFSVAGNYTIKASDGKLTAVTSSAFAIIPGEASKLVVLQGPGNEVAGVKIAPALTVAVEDKYGNVVTTDGSMHHGDLRWREPEQRHAWRHAHAGRRQRHRQLRRSHDNTSADIVSPQPTPRWPWRSPARSTSPLAAAELAFAQAPTDTVAGSTISPNVTVDVEDKFGNLVTTNKSKVTVAIAGPTGAKMLGTLTQTAVNGVATFTDLAPQTAGASTLPPPTPSSPHPRPPPLRFPGNGCEAGLRHGARGDRRGRRDILQRHRASRGCAGQRRHRRYLESHARIGQRNRHARRNLEAQRHCRRRDLQRPGDSDRGCIYDLRHRRLADKCHQWHGDDYAGGRFASRDRTGSHRRHRRRGDFSDNDRPGRRSIRQRRHNRYVQDHRRDQHRPDGCGDHRTAQVTAVKGVGTFTGISLKTAGSYKLSFSDASLTAPTSSSFTISAAAAAKLAFGVAPSAAAKTVAISPAITVEVEDQFGNVVTTDS